jgi:two-component system, cell cycle sensor histidine kinase and response regulator CckA
VPRPLRVLVIEDSEDDTLLLLRELRRGGYEPTAQRVENAAEMEEALRQKWDIIISDYSLPNFDPLRALRILQNQGLDIPCIVISGSVDESTILAAMRAGAGDYLMKDNLMRLTPAVERELREAEGRRELRRLEEQFRHAQKMEAIGRLAGGVAHDFNNLLTVIIGYSDLLLSTTTTTLPEPTRSALDEIRKAADRGGELTRQLLIFSRRQTLNPKIVHLNELVANMEKMLRRLIGEDIDLVTLFKPGLNEVVTDEGQFEQVIMNLVVNARDAMPNGGKLTIETANVEVSARRVSADVDLAPGSYVMLAITDSGIGIDAETRSHLFEPFFTTKEAGKGTGLGLATAYGIVRQSGGEIAVYSEPGYGATFRIYLPSAHSTEAPPPAKTANVSQRSGSETILLLEDDPKVRHLIRQVLAAKGYHVLEAASGEEAIRLVRNTQEPIHLLLADVVLPEAGGPVVAKQIAAFRPGLRTLFISGYTDETMSRHGILDSATSFLSKPFLPETLAEKVREVLDAGKADEGAEGAQLSS